jgi:hypothetical protein
MRTILTIFVLSLLQTTISTAQSRFVSADYAEYYDWFHNRSQVAQLYTDGTTLIVFGEQTILRHGPCQDSEALATLAIGQPVQNIAYDEYYLPEDEIDGYGDIWYHVSTKNKKGEPIIGYIWGAHIAKGWRQQNLLDDTAPELLLLGVSSKPRLEPKAIAAELRIVQDNRLVYQKQLPGLCIFEDCASSPLLRIIDNHPLPGQMMIEASTMTIGCFAGIEKAYLHWNGKTMEAVHQAEYTTEQEILSRPFVVRPAGSTKAELCSFSHEDENFTPVWTCKPIQVPANTETKPTAAVENTAQAR